MAKKKVTKEPVNNYFKALVKDVIDGDTIECLIALPLDVFLKSHVRLYGVNTEELKSKSKKALDAKEYMLTTLLNKNVTLNVYGKEKYGRILADVYLDAELINQTLITNGLAVEYKP